LRAKARDSLNESGLGSIKRIDIVASSLSGRTLSAREAKCGSCTVFEIPFAVSPIGKLLLAWLAARSKILFSIKQKGLAQYRVRTE
jgi:hypothetical protein